MLIRRNTFQLSLGNINLFTVLCNSWDKFMDVTIHKTQYGGICVDFYHTYSDEKNIGDKKFIIKIIDQYDKIEEDFIFLKISDIIITINMIKPNYVATIYLSIIFMIFLFLCFKNYCILIITYINIINYFTN